MARCRPTAHLALRTGFTPRTVFTMLALLAAVTACTPVGSPGGTVGLAPVAPDQPIEHQFGLPPHALEAMVVSVVDGDTITVQIGHNTETLRLLGIDTPEKPGGPRPAECHGQQASELAHELLPEGTRVLLARDAEPRDLYGRLLTYVYRSDDELFVNLALIDHGAAAPLAIAPNDTFDDLFARSADTARAAQRGLWGTCGRPDLVLEP